MIRARWKWLFVLPLIISVSCNRTGSDLRIKQISCENRIQDTGVESFSPHFSWCIESDRNGTCQSAYRILVADNPELLRSGNGNMWNSDKVVSEASILVTYAGIPLKPGKKYWWKVEVWDQSGTGSGWSEPASFQTGLKDREDWSSAGWIGYEEMPDSLRVVPGVTGYGKGSENKVEKRTVIPQFRKNFTVTGKVASATLYITGLGQYEARINGNKTGDAFLTPGWSHYDKTVYYDLYDVTTQIRQGENVIGVVAGNGFYYNNRERYRKLIIAYGYPKILCKLIIRHADGTEQVIVTGPDWRTTASPLDWSGIYGGEDYDAGNEKEGWDRPGYDDSGWKQALVVKEPGGKLKLSMDYPVKVMEQFEPVGVRQLNDSVYTYDFGQNISGIIEMKVKGRRGSRICLYPGELIHEDGTVNQRATGSSYRFTYILKGDREESWRPRFSYYGFRYVQVIGGTREKEANDLPQILELKSLHTRNSAPETGSFECSNELFNRIHQLIQWSIKSNLQSVVTDCPHREKLGWIEQTHLMGEGIHFNFDLYHLYRKLIADMADAQTATGLVPGIVPEYINFDYLDPAFRDSPEWGSACIILPWMIYKWYGDRSVMEESWPMMTAYTEYLRSKSKANLLSHGLGDWYDLGPERPGYTQLTPVPLVATAAYYQSTTLMADIAAILGKTEAQKEYSTLAEEIKTSFNHTFFNKETKVYSTGSQTAMAMPLSVGLVEGEFKKKGAAKSDRFHPCR